MLVVVLLTGRLGKPLTEGPRWYLATVQQSRRQLLGFLIGPVAVNYQRAY